ncbi:hypothetical protein N7470_007447 [Penicillium chermesinum]|nr:hypothetical protein N7470_007447 [Penicillium chermesinum]
MEWNKVHWDFALNLEAQDGSTNSGSNRNYGDYSRPDALLAKGIPYEAFQQITHNLANHVKFVNVARLYRGSIIEEDHGLWLTSDSISPCQLFFVNPDVHLGFGHIITDGHGATSIMVSLLEALNEPRELGQEKTESVVQMAVDQPGFPVDPLN